jgi:hypothetical protein
MLFSTVADAQSFWSNEAIQKLEDTVQLQSPNYVLSQPIMTGSLTRLAQHTQTVHLVAGVEYAIAATCDSNCDVDLDVALPQTLDQYDDQNIVDSESSDGTPITMFTPRYTANYAVTVEMVDCSSESCPYAIGVFTKVGDS